MSWKENKAVRLFTPAHQELTDRKPDINDLLLLGQAALAHSTRHSIAVSSSGPLSISSTQFLPPPPRPYYTAFGSISTSSTPPSLPLHPVKQEPSSKPPAAVSLVPVTADLKAVLSKPPINESYINKPVVPHQPLVQLPQPPPPPRPRHEDLKALSERLSMPPPPAPPAPQVQQPLTPQTHRTTVSPPTGVSSSSEVADAVVAGLQKKTTAKPNYSNDRSDIGKTPWTIAKVFLNHFYSRAHMFCSNCNSISGQHLAVCYG
jgi:hypothetical protein